MDLLILGGLLLVGLVADMIGRLTPLPRITWLLACGVMIGPYGLDAVSARVIDEWFPTLTDMALSMVGFLLGRYVAPAALRERGFSLTLLALGKVLGAASAVFVGLILIGVEVPLALVFAGVATATAPAATYDVVRESGAQGIFVDQLLSIVAIDDALGLILFSLLLATATALGGGAGLDPLIHGLFEVGGSVLLGAILGVTMGYLSIHLTAIKRNGDSIQTETFGFVFIAAGGATVLGLSPILTAMTLGAVVASHAGESQAPFRSVEQVEWPFMILFFIFAGASLRVDALATVGALGFVYVSARALGTWFGLAAADRMLRKVRVESSGLLSLALLPQAGVALGMALLASQRMPQFAESILTVSLATTFVLEVTAPVLTRWALRKSEGDHSVT